MTSVRDTLAWLKREGVAPLPAPYGMKGTVIPRWPSLPLQLAEEVTSAWLDGTALEDTSQALRDWFASLDSNDRERLARAWEKNAGKPINLAARTSPAFGVADVDTTEDADAFIARFPRGCPIDRTARGFRVYFKPARPIGNGRLAGIEGEYFTAPHLVMVAGSRHPDGIDYEWVRPPNGSLPVVDLEGLGLVAAPSENEVSITCRRKEPVKNLDGHFATLTRLLGEPERAGRWRRYLCPFHQCSKGAKEFGVTPDGWCLCFRCGERGWIDTIIKRLTNVCNGNFVFQDGIEALQCRVIEALEAMGQDRLAREMRMCGRYFKVYKCKNGHSPAYPVSCKSPFCPRCRGKRLAKHLADRTPLFEDLTRPVGFLLTPPALQVQQATDARRKAKEQTDALLTTLRNLSHTVPQLKNMIRAVSPSCTNLSLQVTHAVVLDDLDERARATIVMALGQSGVKVETRTLSDGDEASRWLFRRAVRFSFETNEDLLTILLAFKGMSIIRGWGQMRGATGGMLKGKAPAPKPTCPFCGAELGKPIGEVPQDQVEWVERKAWRWRGPPPLRRR